MAVFLAGFQSSPELSIPGADQKDRASNNRTLGADQKKSGLWGEIDFWESDFGEIRFPVFDEGVI